MPQKRSALENGRIHRSYDPYEDFERRYPDWRIEFSTRPELGIEVTPAAKMMLIGRHDFLRDPHRMVGNAVALLDGFLHRLEDGVVPEEWQDEADLTAQIRLGRAWVRA